MNIRPAELIAAVSYMMDVFPGGCCYHSWRVGLVAQKIASILAPELQRDVFYAGLLQDIGTAGAFRHITIYTTNEEQMCDPHIKGHAEGGAALVRWLPGMDAVADYIKSHHEWYDGSGYPGKLKGDKIPLGSQILRLVDSIDSAGCFAQASELESGLWRIAGLTGRAWAYDVWAAFMKSLEDSHFYNDILDPNSLPGLIESKIAELPVPEQLENETGVERVFHLFPVIIDERDTSTCGHSLRVASMAESVAIFMGLSEKEAHTAYRAGLVHDAGRLGIPTAVLNKVGRLNAHEMDIVRKHARMTIRIMSCIPNCPDMLMLGQIAGHDHERYDGNGYPDKLSGDHIPLISRILGAVDSYDAMTSSRSYRILSPKGAIIRVQQNAGKQFDPKVVDAMIDAFNSGALGDQSAIAA